MDRISANGLANHLCILCSASVPMRDLSTNDVSQATILVADTDSESLFTIASILIAQKHRVLTARSTMFAAKLALQEPLDLLITDTQIGSREGINHKASDVGGIELVRKIRKQEDKSELPVMYLSALQAPGVIRRMHDFGAAFHLKKPVDPQVLIELVDKALWMPHLVRNQIEQKRVKQPHVSFANNPIAEAFGATMPVVPF